MRRLSRIIGIVSVLVISAQALAPGIGDLSSKETAAGLEEALASGVEAAIGRLGKTNGFMGDPQVRIPLPPSLRAAEKMMRTLGSGSKLLQTVFGAVGK
jgi:hypothetical protein